jgi:PAS domain S-box-containing protein
MIDSVLEESWTLIDPARAHRRSDVPKHNVFTGDVYKFLERAADAAFVVTLDGEICFWNAAAEDIFEFTASEVLNRTCHDVLQGTGALGTVLYAGEFSVHRCAAHNDSIPTFDLEVTTSSGRRKWVSVSTIVFEDSRLHRRLLAHLAHDISERKELEQSFSKMIELAKQILGAGSGETRPSPIEPLSGQEARILKLFAAAKNSGQVARELKITPPTLRNHLHSINRKLRTHSRLEAVLHATKRGLI